MNKYKHIVSFQYISLFATVCYSQWKAADSHSHADLSGGLHLLSHSLQLLQKVLRTGGGGGGRPSV